jgi:hypothetical protein
MNNKYAPIDSNESKLLKGILLNDAYFPNMFPHLEMKWLPDITFDSTEKGIYWLLDWTSYL